MRDWVPMSPDSTAQGLENMLTGLKFIYKGPGKDTCRTSQANIPNGDTDRRPSRGCAQIVQKNRRTSLSLTFNTISTLTNCSEVCSSLFQAKITN